MTCTICEGAPHGDGDDTCFNCGGTGKEPTDYDPEIDSDHRHGVNKQDSFDTEIDD
jgi:hypothetical protein